MKIALTGRYGEGEILTGPEKVAQQLFLQLKEKNINVIFIEYFFSGYSDSTFLKKIFGRKIIESGVVRLGIIPLIIKLLYEQYDLIHLINSQRFTLIIFYLKPLLKSRVISSFHGFQKYEKKLVKVKRAYLDSRNEKLSVDKSEVLVYPSELLLKEFRKSYKLNKKVTVIYNGIEERFFKINAEKYYNTGFNFVYYNSFNEGIDVLLENFPLDPVLKLFIIGYKEKLNLEEKTNVFFLDPMNQDYLINFLADKHFVIKCAFESFSIFTAECMAMGIIPIVSENIGIKELISDNVNGLVFNSNIRESLSSVIKNISDKKFNLNELSSNAIKIYDDLNWGKISNQYISLYDSMI